MRLVQPKDFEVKTNEERKNPLKILQHQLGRFLHRLKGKENNFKILTNEELIQSRNLLVKCIQQIHFYSELKNICNHNCVNFSSKLKSLDPFLGK